MTDLFDLFDGQVYPTNAFYEAVKYEDPLELSIKKWEFIVRCFQDGYSVNHDGGCSSCALCRTFRRHCKCTGCPVMEASGEHGCENTPYEHWRGLQGAREELGFLKSLREDETITGATADSYGPDGELAPGFKTNDVRVIWSKLENSYINYNVTVNGGVVHHGLTADPRDEWKLSDAFDEAMDFGDAIYRAFILADIEATFGAVQYPDTGLEEYEKEE